MRSGKYGVGIIGCGKMGRIYADWFSKNPHCAVRLFYNRTLSTAQALSARYPGSAAAVSWPEVAADPGIDIIGICTPSHEHPEQFIAAVKAGKHVLCEKPMANNVNDCARMAAAAQNAGVRAAVGFQMRFHPVVRKVNELVGGIGRIYGIDFRFGMYRPEVTWKHKIDQQGGVMKELLSHLIDLASFWLGEPESVFGVNRIIQPGREVEDFTRNIIRYRNGATVTLSGDLFEQSSRAIHGSIMGTGGQIMFRFSSYDPADSAVALFLDGDRQDVPVEIPSEIDAVYPGHLDSFKTEIDLFVEAVRSGRGFEHSVRQGRQALEVIDASYESQRTGERVPLPLAHFDTSHIADCFKRF